jgi:glutathione S-transferase
MTIHLLTIPISHYCEKARWGLERLGLAYREEAHIQGFHYWRTWRLSRQPLVPVLIDNVLGIESRRWFYFQYRQQPVSAILGLIAQRVPAHERLLAHWLLRPMQAFARKRLNISLRTVEAGLGQVSQVLAHTDALLADGRPYLLGDRFRPLT